MFRIVGCAAALMLVFGSAFAADEVGFSPSQSPRDAEAVVLDAIQSAHKSVHMAAFQLSSEPILSALMNARRRGLDVRVVLDYKVITRKKHADKKAAVAEGLMNAGVGLRVDSRNPGVMHNKFIVIDGTSVETGSFNFTYAADHRSANNAFWLRSEPSIAADYETEWNRLWNESGPYTSDPPR